MSTDPDTPTTGFNFVWTRPSLAEVFQRAREFIAGCDRPSRHEVWSIYRGASVGIIIFRCRFIST